MVQNIQEKKASASSSSSSKTSYKTSSKVSSKAAQKLPPLDQYFRMIKNQINPSFTFSTPAINSLNSIVNSIFKRIAAEASSLARKQRRPTLLARDIEFACRLVIPQELGNEVLTAGGTAVSTYEHTLVLEELDRAERRGQV